MLSNKRENKRIYSILPFVLILPIVLIAFLLYSTRSVKDAPRPVKGVLDLSDWDLNDGRPSLAGEWDFYWNKLYTYKDVSTIEENQVNFLYVPERWKSQKIGDQKISGFGYGTYCLKVILKDTNQTLSLQLNNMATSYKMYINETEVAHNGSVGVMKDSYTPGYKTNTVTFQPPSKEFTIILQVANYDFATGGIRYEIIMGTPEQVGKINRITVYKDSMLLGSLFIMALYYASFYIVLKEDKSSIYMMLLCIFYIIRTSLFGDVFLVRLLPMLSFGFLIKLMYCCLYWITVILLLMVDSLYPKYVSAKIKRIMMIYGILATLLTIVLPASIYTRFIYEIEGIGLVTILYLIIRLLKAQSEYKTGAILIMIALAGIFITAIYDILYHISIVYNSFGELVPIGIFQFLFIFSFILAQRLFNAYENANELTNQLTISLRNEKAASDELLKAELSFLKAQIKPHFLYNSLSVIMALSTENPQRTKELLYDLSRYLRGSFDFENYEGVMQLQNELTTVRAYLSIEKERYQGKLRVVYDIDETINVYVPLLSIQPLVENAIRHGIMKKSEGGTVTLRIYKEDSSTIIVVKDDGIGIPAEKCANILNKEELSTGVGLKNIHRRLMLQYGQGLYIASKEGVGTRITMTIPE